MIEKARSRAAGVLAALAALLAPALALAQEYQPVQEATRPKTDPAPYVAAAYGFIWVALVVYVVFVARGLARAQRDVEELRRRVDRAGQAR